MKNLKLLQTSTPIYNLTPTQTRELQSALAIAGYDPGGIDGIAGARTALAWKRFKRDHHQAEPEFIGTGSIALLEKAINPTPSFSTRIGTIAAIKAECDRQKITNPHAIAYIIATAEWETAYTFQPVKEAYWMSESWRKTNLRYYPFYGRGYVQLTWQSNYKKYTDILKIDLVGQPDLALVPQTALFILVHGFLNGTFTGQKLSDYFNHRKTDLTNARRIINGNDKARAIAQLALKYIPVA